MNIVEYISIYLFPMALLLIIFINNIMKFRRTSDSRLFDALTIINLALMFTDILSGAAKVQVGERITWKVVSIEVLCMVLMLFASAMWSAYVCCRLYHNSIRRHTYILVGSAMGICTLAVSLEIFFWVRHYFLIGMEKVQQLIFKCNLGLSVLAVCMMLGSCIMAIWFYCHEKMREDKQECLYLMVFSVIPIAGIVVQNINMSWRMAGPSIALAILYIYVSMQNKKVITDSLTGVNNRRELEAHIDRRTRHPNQADWGILMIDVDSFKQINDRYGHHIGDEALWDVADILKCALSKENAFIARYGGDEFTVCVDNKDGEYIPELINMLEDEVTRFNTKSKRVYKLSISIGGVTWEESGRNKENMLKLADSRMYEMKRRKEQER